MTDFQRFITLLESFGFKASNDSVWCLDHNAYSIKDNNVIIGSGSGYSGFYHIFEFDAQQKFIDHAGLE